MTNPRAAAANRRLHFATNPILCRLTLRAAPKYPGLTCACKMLLEDQRFIHEDLERLEQAIADRVAEEPRNVSSSLRNCRLRF